MPVFALIVAVAGLLTEPPQQGEGVASVRNSLASQTPAITGKLIPYDMFPAKIGNANLLEIHPHYMLYGSYRAPGGPLLDLSINKDGIASGPACVAGNSERAERLKIGKHPACYFVAFKTAHGQRLMEWNVSDFEVVLSIRDGTNYSEGRRLLKPAAEEVGAWLDSILRAGGPDPEALRFNRKDLAYPVAVMRESVEKTVNEEPSLASLRKQTLQIQDPDRWYVQKP